MKRDIQLGKDVIEPVSVPPADRFNSEIRLSINSTISFGLLFGAIERVVKVVRQKKNNSLLDEMGPSIRFEEPSEQALH